MNEFKKEEEKKGGFWASLASLFGRGSSAAGGAAGLGSSGSGFGAASGLGGLFATKAGVMGMILGGATIAAGIGVVYNFIGPSSKSVYTPQLFQDTYYEEQSQNASRERAKQKQGASASASTLDMFSEQAKKDGLGFGDQAKAADEKSDADADAAVDGAAADAGAGGASVDSAANAPAGGGARLQTSSGFGGAKGGGASPKLAGGGGMFGGSNGQFAPMYKSPAGQGVQGKSSAMKGSMASAIKNSPKRSVPSFNRKGAFGQAKFAKAQGARAAGSSSGAASKTGATEAFSGETTGTGDAGGALGGVGLGGAGVSNGNKLKSSDPSLNSNESTPPPVGTPENVSPWEKYTNMAMYAMLAGALLVFITGVLVKKAEALMVKAKAAAAVPITGAAVAAPLFAAAAAMYGYAQIAAYAAIAAGAVVIFAGITLMSKFGQKWTGIMYAAVGGMLIYKAYEALSGANTGKAEAIASENTSKALIANPSPVVGSGAGTGVTGTTGATGATGTTGATGAGTSAAAVPQPPAGATIAESGNVFDANHNNIGIFREDIGFVPK